MNTDNIGSNSPEEYFNDDLLKSNLRQRTLKSAGISSISSIMMTIIQTTGTIIIARNLTPDDFGLVAMVLSFSLLFQNFGFNGFTEAIIQAPKISHEQISTIFWINIGTNSFLTLVFIAISPFISWFYSDQRLKLICCVLAFTILSSGLSTEHLALLKRNLQFHKIAVNNVTATAISISTAILLTYSGWGYWALVSRWLLLPLCTAIGAWILCRWRPGFPSRKANIRPILKYAINTYGNFMVDYFRRNTDKILLGKFFGPETLGSYDRAYHLSNMLPNTLIHPMTGVGVAALSRLSSDPEKYRRNLFDMFSLLALVSSLVGLILTVTGSDVIILLLGKQWELAARLFPIFGLSVGVLPIYYTNGWIHLSLGTPDKWFRWSIFSYIISLIFFGVGLAFGVIGIVSAYTISFYVLTIPSLCYAGRPIQLNFSSIAKSIWKYYLSAIVSGSISWIILYHCGNISNFYLQLNILLRITFSTIISTCLFIIFTTILFRSISPFRNLLSLFIEVIKKKSNKYNL